MEKTTRLPLTFIIRNYVMLTKPGIIMGNLITAAGGFALASRGQCDFRLLLTMVEGLTLIIASASVLNNYIDRELDSKMARTKNRALPKSLISPRNAMVFAIILGLMGIFILSISVNLLTTLIALMGVIVYVFLYSFLKYRSTQATLVGSIAGAVPPVVGYVAVTNHFDLGAVILFAIIVMWQMPHFFAIAIYRIKDYAAASIPVFPLKKSILLTKIHMMFYILAFMAASLMLSVFNYTGQIYLIVAALVGLTWLCLCIKGFNCSNDQLWARKIFIFSLIAVLALSITIPFSVIY